MKDGYGLGSEGYGMGKIVAKESWDGKAILVSKEGCDLKTLNEGCNI